MATLNKMPSGMIAHKRWEDILSMILGALILISPMFVAAGTTASTVVTATALIGAVIVVLAGLEQIWPNRWEEFLELLCGAWVVAAPFVLNYGGPLRNWHIVLGACVALLAVLELWQDRNRDFAM